MVFDATFNNITIISWRSVLLVEETAGPGENHRPVTSHWQTLSPNVVHLALMMLSFIIVLIRLSWLCCFVSANCVVLYFSVQLFIFTSIQGRGRRGRDRMVDGFTTTYAISFLSPLMWWVQISIRARCTTLGDKVCQWLVTGRWFSPGFFIFFFFNFRSFNSKTLLYNYPFLLIDRKWHLRYGDIWFYICIATFSLLKK
jgi:hypothetical protein